MFLAVSMAFCVAVPAFAADDQQQEANVGLSVAAISPRYIYYYYMCNANNVSIYAEDKDGDRDPANKLGFMNKYEQYATVNNSTNHNGYYHGYPVTGRLFDLYGNIMSYAPVQYFDFSYTDI